MENNNFTPKHFSAKFVLMMALFTFELVNLLLLLLFFVCLFLFCIGIKTRFIPLICLLHESVENAS
jgi:hypothetical protein